ncbi:MAG: cysteine desulfurase, partial [Planctomycetota bacterium]|nr:cysteine desulfurase [Planctomycetota bacterium]
MESGAIQPTLDIDAVRADFPILNRPLPNGKRLVYLDSGASAQKPRQVLDAVLGCYETYYSNVHRGKSTLGLKVSESLEAVREKVRAFLNASSSDEILFTSGSTLALNVVALSWGRANVKAGDEIVVTPMEHHANLVPWQLLAKEIGARIRMLPMTDDGRLDLSRMDEAITSRTKLVAVTQLSNVLGTINPIKELADAAHAVGAVIVVDAAQSIPHLPTDVQELDVDFLVFSGHKLYAPTGIGVLYGRREFLEAMPPAFGGGNMIERVHDDHFTPAPLPAKFEAGTPPIAEAIGLGAAIDYVADIGLGRIAAHEHALTVYAHEQLKSLPGLVIYGPSPARKGGIISFTVQGAAAEDLNFLLDRNGIAVRHGHHCTMPLHERLGVPATIRASFGVYNTKADVDALVEG